MFMHVGIHLCSYTQKCVYAGIRDRLTSIRELSTTRAQEGTDTGPLLVWAAPGEIKTDTEFTMFDLSSRKQEKEPHTMLKLMWPTAAHLRQSSHHPCIIKTRTTGPNIHQALTQHHSINLQGQL